MLGHKVAWMISIATFGLGGIVDSVLSLNTPLPTVEVDSTFRARDPDVTLNGKVQVELVSTRALGRGKREATFKVTNRKDHTVSFPGYSKDSPAQVWIRQNGSIHDAVALPCWMGVDTQTLEPAESAYFTIPIPLKGDYFDVGIDIRVSLRGGWETVWFRFPEYSDRRQSVRRKT